jgi:hypothetical protein
MTAEVDEPAALAYVETTLAAAYRLEVDRAENVWRSLPMLAVVLAIELVAIAVLAGGLPAPVSIEGALCLFLLILAAAAVLASLFWLAASVAPQSFRFVAREQALLTYAQTLIHREQEAANQQQDDPFSARATLRTELARHYAAATDHNRQINDWRERQRGLATIAGLAAFVPMLLLAGASFAHHAAAQN